MIGHPRPDARKSEIQISDGLKVEARIATETPKRLARSFVKQFVARGWKMNSRSPFRELASDCGGYTYRLSRVNPETGQAEKKCIDVVFRIAGETYTGAI